MELPFRIVVKGLLRIPTLKYECPRCKSDLLSPLTDAGQTDRCPDCGFGYTVPGTAELAKQRAVEAEEEESRKRAETEAAEARTQLHSRDREEEARAMAAQRRSAELREREKNAAAGDWVGMFGGVLVCLGVIGAVFGLLVFVSEMKSGAESPNAVIGSVVLLGSGCSALFSGALLMGLDYIRRELCRIHATMAKATGAAQHTPD